MNYCKAILETISTKLFFRLDIRTRWCSLFDMLKRFLLVIIPVKKTLIDLKIGIFIDENVFHILKCLVNVLTPL